MKFVIIAIGFSIVILALQPAINCHPILGLGLNGLGLSLNPLGLTSVGLGLNGLGLGIGGINGLGLNSLGLWNHLGLLGYRADLASSLGVGVNGYPGQSLSQAPSILTATNTANDYLVGRDGIIGYGGSYVARNSGVIHSGPSDGHINSAASVNSVPAPGTL